MGSLATIWGMIRFGIGARSSKDGQSDAIRATPGPQGTGMGQETVARYYPWGYDSRSPDGGKRLCVAPNGGSNLAQIGERNDKAKPDYDDEDWTVTLHNEVDKTWVKLRKDGGVQVSGKAGSFEMKADSTAKWTSQSGATIEMQAGGNISLNGGNSPVIRLGDGVQRNLIMATWMTQVTAAVNGLVPGAVTAFAGERIGNSIDGAPKVTA